MSYRFQQIQHVYQVQDPSLVDMLMALSQQPDPVLMTLIPEDELTFERFYPIFLAGRVSTKAP